MAFETGTATGLNDLFEKIVTFLTTNIDLVTASQQWQILRIHHEGLALNGVVSNLTQTTTVQARRIIHSFRNDTRSTNFDLLSTADGYTTCTGHINGTSYVQMELKVATQIGAVRLRSPEPSVGGGVLNQMPSNFRLQYSDDTIAWTTALTVSSSPSYTFNEYKDFTVPGIPGAHIYWRIIIDSQMTNSATVSWRSMLLLNGSGEIANHFGGEVIFKATGTAGADEIFTGIRTEYDVTNDWYNLFLNGYSGFDPTNQDFFRLPGALPSLANGDSSVSVIPMVPCWNQNMTYWFAASGRSFRLGLKVSTSFEGAYLGFLLPYATPTQYPYPLVVAGSLVPTDANRTTAWRYSYTNYFHSVFPTASNASIYAETNSGTLVVKEPSGTWRQCGNRGSSSDANFISRNEVGLTYPYLPSGPYGGVWPNCTFSLSSSEGSLPQGTLINGGYMLEPIIPFLIFPERLVLGELEGVTVISGLGNAAENTLVNNGVNYVVLQNVGRTESNEYWAMSLPSP